METNSHNFADVYILYSLKMNIKDRTTVCVCESIKSEKLILNEQNQGEVYFNGKNI